MAELKGPRAIVIAGPTAAGKTALAVETARRLNGEIISADSMQIYRGLSVGTAKPDEAERGGVAHHLIDIRDPNEVYSVADFVADANKAAAEMESRGKLPIVCGGTGLYISSLLEGIEFFEEPGAAEVRIELEKTAARDGLEMLYNELICVDPNYAARISGNDKKRIIRALETFKSTGRTRTETERLSRAENSGLSALSVLLCSSERDTLYERINRRTDRMLENGLLNEARLVYENKNSFVTAAQAIGYKELFPYFEGMATLSECTEALKRASRRYAKRQLTWFRRCCFDEILYFDGHTTSELADRVCQAWEQSAVRFK